MMIVEYFKIRLPPLLLSLFIQLRVISSRLLPKAPCRPSNRIHQRLLGQVLDPAGKQVGGILVEEMEDIRESFTKTEGGGEYADRAAELPGCVGRGEG
jgi:hypothetical protein